MTYGQDELDAYELGHRITTDWDRWLAKRDARRAQGRLSRLTDADRKMLAQAFISTNDFPSPESEREENGAAVPPTQPAPPSLPRRSMAALCVVMWFAALGIVCLWVKFIWGF